MWLSDRFPGLMLWHTVAALAAVFAAKALLYWGSPQNSDNKAR